MLCRLLNKYYDIILFKHKCATGVGSIPALSSLAIQFQANWFLGSLTAGLLGASVSNLFSLLPKKGVVLMNTLIIMLSLVACGELV
jgi:hypothetical protein